MQPREPIFDTECERIVLGCVVDGDAWLLGHLSSAEFASPAHRAVLQAAKELHAEHARINLESMSRKLVDEGVVGFLECASWLASLAETHAIYSDSSGRYFDALRAADEDSRCRPSIAVTGKCRTFVQTTHANHDVAIAAFVNRLLELSELRKQNNARATSR